MNQFRIQQAINASLAYSFWKQIFCWHDYICIGGSYPSFCMKCVKCGSDKVEEYLPVEVVE